MLRNWIYAASSIELWDQFACSTQQVSKDALGELRGRRVIPGRKLGGGMQKSKRNS